jgi:hypothetical protein
MTNSSHIYMIATVATNGKSDISRPEGDICIVTAEDGDHYIGQWVMGFGYAVVLFPKATTRPLTEDEVEKYHGKVLGIGSGVAGAINLKGEDFHRKVIVRRKDSDVGYEGTLVAPLKFAIAMQLNGGRTFCSSPIESIDGNEVKTRNSTYVVEYV